MATGGERGERKGLQDKDKRDFKTWVEGKV